MAVVEFNRTKDFIASGVVALKYEGLRAALMGENFTFKGNILSFDDVAVHEVTGLGATGGTLLTSKRVQVNSDNKFEMYVDEGLYWQDVTATISGILIFRDGTERTYSNPLLWWLPTATGLRTLVRSDYKVTLQGPLMRW